MATTPVEVKKPSGPAPTPVPDVWNLFRTEMDRLFDRFAGFPFPNLPAMFATAPPMATRGPAVEITEDENDWRLTAELPGMTEADMEVALADDVLTLRGEKKQEREEKGKDYYLSERSYGSFTRSFIVPPSVDREAIKAEFAKGVLTVTLPKKPEAKTAETKIEVRTAA